MLLCEKITLYIIIIICIIFPTCRINTCTCFAISMYGTSLNAIKIVVVEWLYNEQIRFRLHSKTFGQFRWAMRTIRYNYWVHIQRFYSTCIFIRNLLVIYKLLKAAFRCLYRVYFLAFDLIFKTVSPSLPPGAISTTPSLHTVSWCACTHNSNRYYIIRQRSSKIGSFISYFNTIFILWWSTMYVSHTYAQL